MKYAWLPWSKSAVNITFGNMVLNQDFREFIQSLSNNCVRYLVAGGYAVALHGYPRYTKDIAIWIDASHNNADRLIVALEEFGFGSLELKVEDFVETGQVVQLGYPPNRIDLLTSLTGVDFESCYKSRVVVTIQDTKITFIDLDNLKENKKSVARPQDLADLDNLG
jgi:hypothetical protein